MFYLNRYHKKVISEALDNFETNGDDAWMDIRNNPDTLNAYNQLVKICTRKYKKVSYPKIPYGAIVMGSLTSKDVKKIK